MTKRLDPHARAAGRSASEILTTPSGARSDTIERAEPTASKRALNQTHPHSTLVNQAASRHMPLAETEQTASPPLARGSVDPPTPGARPFRHRPSVPEPPLLLPLRLATPAAPPLHASHAPSLPPRLRIRARNIPSVASPASSPSCISASLPLRLSLPVSLRSLAVGLDLGRLGGFAGTFFHLCWDPIDALLGCFSAGHFVEHLGCVALTAVELLL